MAQKQRPSPGTEAPPVEGAPWGEGLCFHEVGSKGSYIIIDEDATVHVNEMR